MANVQQSFTSILKMNKPGRRICLINCCRNFADKLSMLVVVNRGILTNRYAQISSLLTALPFKRVREKKKEETIKRKREIRGKGETLLHSPASMMPLAPAEVAT